MLKTMGSTLPATAPMTLQDYLALNGPAPSLHVAYGAAAAPPAWPAMAAASRVLPIVFNMRRSMV